MGGWLAPFARDLEVCARVVSKLGIGLAAASCKPVWGISKMGDSGG